MTSSHEPEIRAEALEDSIAHWNRHATGTAALGESVYSDDCALCAVYHRDDFEEEVMCLEEEDEPRPEGPYICKGCPVAERTGQDLCEGSPWHTARTLWIGAIRAEATEDDRRLFRKAAAEMRDFLISLREIPA